jgi:hypothetical protein
MLIDFFTVLENLFIRKHDWKSTFVALNLSKLPHRYPLKYFRYITIKPFIDRNQTK